MDLKGRTAVITGASRGLGAGLAKAFADRGLNLGLCARGESALRDADNVVTAQLDITDENSLQSFVGDVEEKFGTIDLWINNAGVLGPVEPLCDIDVTEFRRHMEINVVGVFLGTRAFVRHLHRNQKGGVLINVSSGAARNGYAGWSAYCAGKAAVDLLTESVQVEEKDNGLRAYAVAPGVIDTRMQEIIRSTPKEKFPMVDKFLQMKADDSFSSMSHVAQQMLELAFDPARADEPVRTSFKPGK